MSTLEIRSLRADMLKKAEAMGRLEKRLRHAMVGAPDA